MRSHIRDYERPDGWSKGQPEVLVAKNVVAKLGEPVVNYEGLHRFITDDIGVPYDDKTSIRLYGRAKHSMLGGFTYPYTRTVHVNAVTAESTYPLKGGTMRIVAHELRHRGDGTTRKLVTAAEVAARWASYKIGYDVSHYVPFLASAPILGALAAKQTWYAVEPPERRARKQEREMAKSPHQADILFPNTTRAAIMAVSGLVPDENLSRLGKVAELRDMLAQNEGITITISDGNEEQVIYRPQSSPFDQEQ